MNINSAFPSKYLKASDLGEAQPIVTIYAVKVEEVGRDNERKPVVYFKGKEKGLVLNKTNAKKIADLVGSPDTDEWEGHQVKLYATETEFGGEPVECIRIKPAKAEKPKPAPKPEPDGDDLPDDPPF